MKKHHFIKKVGMASLLMVMTAFVQVKAADTAAANESLAKVASWAGQAQTDLAVAANSGNVSAVTKATQRADALTAALEEATAAVKAMAAATDKAATASAEATLASAVQKAYEAFTGKAGTLGGKFAEKDGGKAGDIPNIYDTPWKSAGLRSVGQGLYPIANFSDSSGGADFVDRDATPE